uniref:Uncharacterized protein n=1 Tax=Nelumbo nucifera TaxID=4432 RepID=A0A822ZY84_NELNU|nr:TPA_asm: hypothetical protein HUJ06_016825 [Nelumbo nucifera]
MLADVDEAIIFLSVVRIEESSIQKATAAQISSGHLNSALLLLERFRKFFEISRKSTGENDLKQSETLAFFFNLSLFLSATATRRYRVRPNEEKTRKAKQGASCFKFQHHTSPPCYSKRRSGNVKYMPRNFIAETKIPFSTEFYYMCKKPSSYELPNWAGDPKYLTHKSHRWDGSGLGLAHGENQRSQGPRPNSWAHILKPTKRRIC